MKVSFVLPAYKRAFLREAIASILAQTYRDFELVVVDDASPENLKEVVDGFSDRRLSYFRNSENIGGENLVAAWNKAIGRAHGEWCVLASDDDIYAPEFLEKMLGLAARHPGVDLVHARVKIIDGSGAVVGISPAKPEIESAIELLYDRIVRKADQFVPEFMFKRSRLDEIGGFVPFPKAWYSDDATWALMAENGCANCNEPLFSFRCSGLNISTSYSKIFEQAEAGVAYRDWVESYAAARIPSGDVEKHLLDKICENTGGRVLGLVLGEMSRTSFCEWWHVILRSSLPARWKLSCMKSAVKRFLHLT